MPSFSVWAPIVGEAVAQAGQGLMDVYDELSPRNQQRRQAAAQQYLLPLETQARQTALEQQVRAARQPRFVPITGGYALVYPDGREPEVHHWQTGAAAKQPPIKITRLNAQNYIVTYAPDAEHPQGHYEMKTIEAGPTGDQKKALIGQIIQNPALLEDPTFREVTDALKITTPAYQIIPGGAQAVPRGPLTQRMLGGQSPTAAPPSSPTPAPSAQPGVSTPDPRLYQSLVTRFQQMTPEAAAQQVAQYDQTPGTPVPSVLAAIQAYQKVFGALPPGVTVEEQPAPAAALPSPQQRRAAGLPPAQAPTQESAQAIPGTVTIPETPSQQRRAQAEEQRLDIAKRREQDLQTAAGQRSAARIETATRPQRDQLEAITRSEAITDAIVPMITPYTVGMVGRSRAALQSFLGNFPPIAAQQLEQLVQEGQFAARQGTLGETPQDNAFAANWLTRYDPRLQKIDFYLTALAYAHARALRPSGVIRQSDLHAAERVIKNAKSPADLLNVLQTNRTFLEGEKARIQKRMTDTTQRMRTGVPQAGAAPGAGVPISPETDPNRLMEDLPEAEE